GTLIEGLSVIGGGECDPVALAMLAQGQASAIFADLRQQYDFVIVDTSPILPVTDGLLFAQEVDGVLFSILRNVSRLELIDAAHERLAVLNVRILGAVVTGTTRAEAYGRDYYYLGQVARTAASATEQSESAS